MSDAHILSGKEGVDPVAWQLGDVESLRRYLDGECPPRRIDGQFCPFCRQSIPHEFIFCPNCGKNV